MKNIVLIFSLLLISMSLISQDCKMYFPAEEGTVMEIKDYNAKDKLQSSSIQKINSVIEDGNNLTVSVNHESFDKKGEKILEGDYEVKCVDGTFYMDMRNMLDEASLSTMEGMEIQVDANDLAYAFDLNPGTTLPDADITVSASSNGMKMFTMTVYINNRKVDAKESITTPAGTFDCYKISYDIETKIVMKVQAKAVQWISEGIGVVRTETYNKKGKLQGYSLLSSLN